MCHTTGFRWAEFRARCLHLPVQDARLIWAMRVRRSLPRVDVAAAVRALEKSWGSPVEWGSTPFDATASDVYEQLLQTARDIPNGLEGDALEERMRAILSGGHIGSHRAGQRMSGYPVNELLAVNRGRQAFQSQIAYVKGLVLAIDSRDPRYWSETDGWNQQALDARLTCYTGRLRGTASAGFCDAAPGATLYDWDLGAVEEHCDECPILAADGPYLNVGDTSQLEYPTLYTRPGQCDTPCMFNCKCRLMRIADGAAGPSPFSFAMDNYDEEAA